MPQKSMPSKYGSPDSHLAPSIMEQTNIKPLAGSWYSTQCAPHPSYLPAPTPSQAQGSYPKGVGSSVGTGVGSGVGETVGLTVGEAVGSLVIGLLVGECVGSLEGSAVDTDGDRVGVSVGLTVRSHAWQ